jgi:hypothetical protein
VVVLILGLLVWPIWARRGDVPGGLVALGFGINFLRIIVKRYGAWLRRHPVADDAAWAASVGAGWIWLESLVNPRESTADLLTGAATFAGLAAVSSWQSHRKKTRIARRKLLTTLATDLDRLATLRREPAGTADRVDELVDATLPAS